MPATDTPRSLDARVPALAAAVLAFCAYLAWAFPYPDFLDSPELATSAATLGIFHPPGSPLAVVAGHALAFWPFAAGHYRLVVMSPFFAGVAVYVLARLLGGILGRSVAGAVMALACFAIAPGVLQQATRLEVYTMALALGLVVLRDAIEALTDQDPLTLRRRLRRSAFALGAGLCVHPLIALACASAWAVPLVRRRQALFGDKGARTLGISALSLALGGAWLALLPAFVDRVRDYRWGDVGSVVGWLDFVRGKAFAASFSGGSTSDSVANTLILFVNGTGGGMVALAGLLGLALLVRKNPERALLYGLVLALDLATLMTQKSVMLNNPDAVAYLLPAFAVAVLLAAEGLAATVREPRAATLGIAAICTLAVVQMAGEIRSLDRSGCASGYLQARSLLRALPPSAEVELDDFNLVFMLEYLTIVEGERSDVRVRYVRDPQVKSEGGPRLVDASPPRLEERRRFQHAYRRAGLLWTLDETAVAAPRDEEQFAWRPACASGDPVDARAASAFQWQAFMSSQLAAEQGERATAAAFARLAVCAAPSDEISLKHAATLGVSSGDCGAAAAPRLEPDFAGRAPALTKRSAFFLCGLAAWSFGLWRRTA